MTEKSRVGNKRILSRLLPPPVSIRAPFRRSLVRPISNVSSLSSQNEAIYQKRAAAAALFHLQ